ncbi:MAG: DNA primase, partial [Atribacterota bacterium]|nr:DNA primase [Atribacterota bacterium]
MRYSEDVLNEIRNKLDIVELISEYISLKPSGRSYKGLCPFHQEKTPSFMVDSQRQIFHCFGCGEGGNIFSFIMKIEKVNFPEAIELMAEKAGIELPSKFDQDNKSFKEKEIIFQLNEIALKYYQNNIYSQQGKNALNYLTKRYFKEETIQKFHLGYALPGYDNLIKILLKKRYKLQDIIKAGLAVKSKKTGNVIDYFRNRIIFPITNLQGKTIAFGGRVLDNSLPKYINSPETEVYKKSNNLYGLFQAKNEIRKNNRVIIMEGYTDVIIASQFGFENVVASLGTALTEQQIYLIKRFADEVLIAFDADNAGRNATLRSLSMLKKADLKIKIISFPFNYDPADIILKKGKEYFNYLIENSLPLIDYKLSLLMKKYNPKKDESKVAIIKNLYSDLSDIKSQVELQLETKKIAEYLNIDE